MNEVLILGLVLIVKLAWDWQRDRRRDRRREELRHVIGVKPWWGGR